MWHDADGKTFGHQVIKDGALTFHTNWINQGKSWAAQLKRLPATKQDLNNFKADKQDLNNFKNEKHSFIFYFALQVRFFTKLLKSYHAPLIFYFFNNFTCT